VDLTEIAVLLDPTPLPLETGYERLPDGALHVAVRTDMHACTGEMFEWWFRFRPNTQQYVWWHPVDHRSSEWAGTLAPDSHVGSEHVVVEELTGLPAQDLTIQFRDPGEFFDTGAYAAARASGTVTAAVLARIGMSHQPGRRPDGAILGGRLLHIGRDTRWGLALRSHFYLGTDLPGSGASRARVEELVPTELGVALLQHAYNEFTFLSKFLPSLFLGEHPNRTAAPLPW
jgi:DAPG hydrolase PhiG domain